jgi:hypothetical protein
VRDQLRDDIAQEIHDLANDNLVALATYGVTAATLTALQTRIDAYDLIVVGPQTAAAKRTTTTAMLRVEFTRGMMLVNDRIDPLMEQFNGSGTTFYADYKNARNIIDNNGSGTPPTPPVTPP